MVNLLDKIDSIEVKAEDRISQEDRIFVQNTQALYLKALSQLEEWDKLFKEKAKNQVEVEEGFETTEYGSVYSKGANEKDFTSRYQFTTQYPIMHIKKLKDCLNYSATREVITHFAGVYTIKLSIDDYEKVKSKKGKEDFKQVDFENIVDWILHQTGGISLKDKGVQELKDKFTSEVNWSRDSAPRTKISKNMVSLTDYQWYETDWNGRKRLRYDDRKYNCLLLALSHFEDGSTKHRNFSSELSAVGRGHDRYFDFETTYMADNSDKLISLKYYKNGKVDIKFKTNDLAQEFVNYYSLQTEKKK